MGRAGPCSGFVCVKSEFTYVQYDLRMSRCISLFSLWTLSCRSGVLCFLNFLCALFLRAISLLISGVIHGCESLALLVL